MILLIQKHSDKSSMRKGVDCDYDKGNISVDICGTYSLTVNKFNKQQQKQKANPRKTKQKKQKQKQQTNKAITKTNQNKKTKPKEFSVFRLS